MRHLATKIKWQALSQLTFLLTLSILEYSAYATAVGGVSALVLHVLFFNLFTYYWSFEGYALKSKLSRTHLGLLSSNLFYFLYAVLQADVGAVISALSLASNAMLLLYLMKALQLSKSSAGPVYTLIVSSLIAAAIFVVAPLNLMGALWVAEGLALIYLGFTYRQNLIRLEGYAVYTIAIGLLLWNVFSSSTLASFGSSFLPWADLAVLGLLFFAAYQLIDKNTNQTVDLERNAATYLKEAFVLWMVCAQFVLFYIFVNEQILVLAIVPLLSALYCVQKYKLKLAAGLSLVLYIAFLAQWGVGLLFTNTSIILHQPIESWIALVEALGLAWYLQSFYEKFDLDVPTLAAVRKLRNLITFAPVFLLFCALAAMSNMSEVDKWFIFADLLIIIALALIGQYLSKQTKMPELEASKYLVRFRETLSLSLALIFLYSISLYSLDWMFVASVIPFACLLYRGLKENLRVTEVLGWLCLPLLTFGIVRGFDAAGSLHFSDQEIVTRVAMGCLLFSAWLAEWIYDRSGKQSKFSVLAKLTRTAAYLCIPLLFLPSIARHFPEYLSLGFWLSLGICWLMHKRLQLLPLLVELRILFYIASLSVIYNSVIALMGQASPSVLFSVLGSSAILLTIHYVEKSLVSIKGSEYRHILWLSVHYLLFCFATVLYASGLGFSLLTLVLGVCYLLFLHHPKFRSLVKDSLVFSYLTMVFLLSLIPAMVFTKSWGNDWFGLINICSVACLAYAIHKDLALNRLLKFKFKGEVVQILLFNGILMLSYFGISNAYFGDGSIASTICLLLHAVGILFLTLKSRFKVLLKLSLFLYALTAIKLLGLDLVNFGSMIKVSALMGIGIILMIAAYYYQAAAEKARSS